MKHYEVLFMVHPDQSDQVPSMLERYRQLIQADKGSIHRLEDWGRRQLAYSIAKVHKAHYILMNIECNPGIVTELENLFRFNDAVLRHLILSRPAAITKPSVMMTEKEQEHGHDRYRDRGDRGDRGRSEGRSDQREGV